MTHAGTFTKVNGMWDDVWGYRIPVSGDEVKIGDEVILTTKAGKASTVYVLNVQGIDRSIKFGDAIIGEFSKSPVTI